MAHAAGTPLASVGRIRGAHGRDPDNMKIVLDDLSKQIIEQLQQDGRRSYASIGKAVGLSEAAVRQRVQRLIEAGAMQIVAVTDPMTLGFPRQTMLGVRCGGDLERVAGQLAGMEEIDYVVITAGSFDILVEVVCENDDQLLDIIGRIRRHPERDQHRELCLPEIVQADLQLGDQMSTTYGKDEIAKLQEAAKRNLWLHFTRMSSYAGADIPVIVRGSGQYVYDQNGKRYLDGLAGCSSARSAMAGPRWPKRAPGRAASLRISRCGPTPIRARLSWPSGWPRSRPET